MDTQTKKFTKRWEHIQRNHRREKDYRLFEAEIKVGTCVAAKITWMTDLPGLLMYLERELSPDYTV